MATYTTMKSDETITVQDFIAMKNSDEITYYNFSIVEYLNGYDMFITNVLYDYEEELRDLSVFIKLTDVERIKYRYKPYLFAYDLYGTREIAFIIMMLNGIIDPKEFDFRFRYLTLPKASVLQQFLSSVYNSEKDWLTTINPF